MEEGDRRGAAIYDAVRYSVKLLEKQPDDSRRVLLLNRRTPRSWQPRCKARRCHCCDQRLQHHSVADTATACPNNGGTFQLDGERVRVKDTGSNFTIEYYTYLRADDVAGSSANAQINLVHPMFSRLTYLSATMPVGGQRNASTPGYRYKTQTP
jgi:hypothetical protein